MWFVWGQPVRMFYRVCFGDQKERWNHRRVKQAQTLLASS
jgi:hypothetical protein